MATRNIARTAIEGGRGSSCRSLEHESLRSERTRVRTLLRKVCVDPELADVVQMPTRNEMSDWIDRDFNDKLGPVKRWLESKVGQDWALVYSEIRRKFDLRTTAGRHIVGHIRHWVNFYREPVRCYWVSGRGGVGGYWHYYSFFDFEIDDCGVLRRSEEK